jgi:hypothetical protein
MINLFLHELDGREQVDGTGLPELAWKTSLSINSNLAKGAVEVLQQLRK